MEEDTKRFYPYGSLASNVIGFTNSASVGIYGVESYYEQYLKGRSGKIITAQDALGQDMPFEYESYVGAENGTNGCFPPSVPEWSYLRDEAPWNSTGCENPPAVPPPPGSNQPTFCRYHCNCRYSPRSARSREHRFQWLGGSRQQLRQTSGCGRLPGYRVRCSRCRSCRSLPGSL